MLNTERTPAHAIVATYANMAASLVDSCPSLDQYSSSSDLCEWIRAIDRNAECDPSDCISDLWGIVAAILMD